MKALEEVRALEDHPKSLQECVDILLDLQRNSGKVAEIITILKYEKPLLHSRLKKRLSSNPGIFLLMDLSIGYEQAKESLKLT
ncbi:hypothetical protein [Paenibacillus sp. GP183]|uniref:hypothetical protein n=1 Tax=Paenibacillus sp. GP183 TaxID=1882751 RepID=UPI000897B05B|nr:hypothetical protein [Paenibacillus sp. GP183]SEC65002.1 hypothetical protein SAMN05443246_4851 [Paenibacillus sp. GP183]